MAKQLVTVCDLADTPGDACAGQVVSFRIWRDGDKAASAVDVCETHSSALQVLLAVASEIELPPRPRSVMHVTKLKTTEATRHLKKG